MVETCFFWYCPKLENKATNKSAALATLRFQQELQQSQLAMDIENKITKQMLFN